MRSRNTPQRLPRARGDMNTRWSSRLNLDIAPRAFLAVAHALRGGDSTRRTRRHDAHIPPRFLNGCLHSWNSEHEHSRVGRSMRSACSRLISHHLLTAKLPSRTRAGTRACANALPHSTRAWACAISPPPTNSFAARTHTTYTTSC